MHFTDGTRATCDVLVGADGIGSRTRKAMYSDLANRVRDVDPEKAAELEKPMEPSFTGTYQYRALVDGNKLREKSPNNVSLTESATVRPSTLSVRQLILIMHIIVTSEVHWFWQGLVFISFDRFRLGF